MYVHMIFRKKDLPSEIGVSAPVIIYWCVFFFCKCIRLHDTNVITLDSVKYTHVINYGANKSHQKLKKKSQTCAIHVHNYMQF